jgi:hypothetical protein
MHAANTSIPEPGEIPLAAALRVLSRRKLPRPRCQTWPGSFFMSGDREQTWPPSAVARLRQLWPDASISAAAIGRDPVIKRNKAGVLRKVRGLGLTPRPSPLGKQPPRPVVMPRPTVLSPAPVRVAPPPLPRPLIVWIPEPPPPPRPAVPSLWGPSRKPCRWMVATGSVLRPEGWICCGVDRVGSGSYCEVHARASYVHVARRVRAA